MLAESIEKMVHDEVESRVAEFKDILEETLNDLDFYKDKFWKAEKNNALLKDKVENDLKMSVIFEKVNVNNFEEFINTLGFEKEKVEFNGMNTERLPIWFKAVNTYYNDRETIFTLMDMFKIDYPYWAKSYVNPQNYGEKELDMLLDNVFNMYVCNGEIFSRNMGFFYQTVNRHKANVFEFEQYYQIPWNLFLQNKLLTSEKYFNKIIDLMKENEQRAQYFYEIQKYQALHDDQIELILDTLPKDKLQSWHIGFLAINNKALKVRTDLAESFKHKMESYGGAFHYKNFPINYQIDFIKNRVSDLLRKIEMINGLELGKKEKIKIINEVLEDGIE